MKLYHISKELINEFIPRVPKTRALTEDGKIPRICVAENIIGCVKAWPYRNPIMKHQIEGKVLYIHEFECNDYLTPEDLSENFYVPDALYTRECWIDYKIKPTKITKIKCLKYSIYDDCKFEYEEII